MSEEIIFEEKDNGTWKSFWPTPCRIDGYGTGNLCPGTLSLTKKSIHHKPREKQEDSTIPIKDILAVKCDGETTFNGSRMTIIYHKNDVDTQIIFFTRVRDEWSKQIAELANLQWFDEVKAYMKPVEKSNSELKNTCKRCGKIWYLGPNELEHLEGQLKKSKTFTNQMTGIGLISALFDPMLSAQSGTTLAATTGVMKSQVDELNEKSRCPECQSKNIDRVLVDENEKIEKTPQETNKNEGSSLADELKKLSDLKEQGILDEEEFKNAKRKLMEN